MRIDQRNAGANVVQSGTSGNYTLDRWQNFFSQTSKYSVQRSSSAPSGFSNSILISSLASTTVGANDYFMFSQSIEGYNIADLGWGTADAKTVKLSFWVRSSLTGTFSGGVSSIWSTGGSYYVYEYTINAANTWEYKTITIPGATIGTWANNENRGIIVSFSLGVGSAYSGSPGSWGSTYIFNSTGSQSIVGTSGATLYITGVQFEVGTVATPFEFRQYGQELALCHRYYYRLTSPNFYTYIGNGRSINATYGDVLIHVPVPMRVTPVLGYSSLSHFQCNFASTLTLFSLGGAQSGLPTTGYLHSVGPGSATAGLVQMVQFNNASASAWVDWSAEL
jgi:hypothetical protein